MIWFWLNVNLIRYELISTYVCKYQLCEALENLELCKLKKGKSRVFNIMWLKWNMGNKEQTLGINMDKGEDWEKILRKENRLIVIY